MRGENYTYPQEECMNCLSKPKCQLCKDIYKEYYTDKTGLIQQQLKKKEAMKLTGRKKYIGRFGGKEKKVSLYYNLKSRNEIFLNAISF